MRPPHPAAWALLPISHLRPQRPHMAPAVQAPATHALCKASLPWASAWLLVPLPGLFKYLAPFYP